MEPEEGSIIQIYYEPDVTDQINIIFWIARNKPSVSLVYSGIKNMYGSQSTVTAHTWKLPLGSPFTNYKEHADKYINAYLKQDASFPENHFLTLHMFQDDIYYPPSLYGRFREIINLKPYYAEALKKCPTDCYPVEIAYLTRGWFVFVKKAAYNSRNIMLSDIIFYT